MMIPPFSFDLNTGIRPEIARVGNVVLNDRNFKTRYCLNEMHALHFYFYHCRIRTEQQVFNIHPCDVTCTPAGCATAYSLPEPGAHIFIHFRYPGNGKHTVPFLLQHHRLPKSILADFQEILRCRRKSGDERFRLIAENTLDNLLLKLHCSQDECNPLPDSRLQDILDTLDRNIEQPVSVAGLARSHGISQTHLGRLFKGFTGYTIPQYIMRRRIEKAAYLLSSTELSLKEIGGMVGYQSAQEFNKRYRQITGHPPSADRAASL